MESDALSEVKGPGLAVIRDLPGLGDVRFELHLLPRRVADQAVEDGVHSGPVHGGRGPVGVKGFGVTGIKGDVQDLLVGQLLFRSLNKPEHSQSKNACQNHNSSHDLPPWVGDE